MSAVVATAVPPASAAHGRVVLVSNRLPITARIDGHHVEIIPSVGGLATALREVHAHADSLWVGWPGDPGRPSADARTQLDAALAQRRLVPVELGAGEVARYYDGFANGVLWPACHYMIDRVRREATADWLTYRQVNQRFATRIAAIARPGDQVWIHDYHLMLVPALLRRLTPGVAIGFFLHVPFPAAEVFRILPWREPLLRGLLGADLVGFHTADYASHFRDAAVALCGAEPRADDLELDDRRVAVRAYPIGIDAAAFARRAASAAVGEQVDEWRRRMHGQRIVLGVDRLDYTKGIPRRLLALERLLERWPTWRERLYFLQLAVPTRERGDEYVAFRRDVHELVGRINGRFGTPGWVPIHFLHRAVDDVELSALYRAADVMVVTPVRDGMNLVAKEYCASRIDDGGVLVLSELAGAAAELRAALLVNPFDLDATAAALRRGLEMPAAEQRARMQALRAIVSDNDVARWAEGFLADLVAVAAPPGPTGDGDRLADAVRRLRAAADRLLVLDYDGTLVPLAPMPDLAYPDDELRGLLAQLAAEPGTEVHVVSGRGRDVLDAWLGDLPLGLHAEHGAWSRWPGEAWTAHHDAVAPELAGCEVILTELTRRTPGALIERKGASLAWHYRMVEASLAARRLAELRRRLVAALGERLMVLEGSKVLELRPRGVDKGAAARRILARHAAGDGVRPAILAIGDDRTDEDLFAAVDDDALTVRVGGGGSRARYAVDGPDDVRALLRGLV